MTVHDRRNAQRVFEKPTRPRTLPGVAGTWGTMRVDIHSQVAQFRFAFGAGHHVVRHILGPPQREQRCALHTLGAPDLKKPAVGVDEGREA
jgi:hypothetical protein